MGADYRAKHAAILGGTTGAAQAANQTRFYNPNGSPATPNENDARMVIPFACHITNLYVRSRGPAGAGETYDYQVFLNGNATGLILQIAGGAAVTAGPDTTVVAVAAGDEISIRIVSSAAANAENHMWSLEVNK